MKKPQAYMLLAPAFGNPAGTTVYECLVHDYGLARDDTALSGEPHKSVTLDPAGGWPTFTAKESYLQPVAAGREEVTTPGTMRHAVEHVVNAVIGPDTTAAQIESLLSGAATKETVQEVVWHFRKLGMLEANAREVVRRLVVNNILPVGTKD